MQPVVRAMKKSDFPQVLDIERQCHSHPWSDEVFDGCLRPDYDLLVLELDGQLAGYGVVARMYDEAHLLNLCVSPRWQGQGHARFLLRQLLQRAGDSGMRQIILEVRASNRIAQKLYLSEGFAQIGERPGYYPGIAEREDALVMSLPLSVA